MRVLKEPLLHFALLGIGFFVLDALLGERTEAAGKGRIVVSEGRIENLAGLFAKTWQRPPTAEELHGLVDDFVLEEALYREGLAQGVDQGDTIIRRRVRQKMEFVIHDVAELATASEEDLEGWLADHPERYSRKGRFRFRQVYFSPDRRGDRLEREVEASLVELRAADESFDPRPLGDPSLLEHAFPDASFVEVDQTFGEGFAAQLAVVPIGEWSGPLQSAFGPHLVFLDAYTPGAAPHLDEVREDVERDWSYAQREALIERYHEELLDRYELVIDWPGFEDEGPPQ